MNVGLAYLIVTVSDFLSRKARVHSVRSSALCYRFGDPCEDLRLNTENGEYYCVNSCRMAERKSVRVRESSLVSVA